MNEYVENTEKEKIASSSEKIIKKIYTLAPPINSEGKIDYYIAGSLITNVLSKIKIMDNYKMGLDRNALRQDIIEIPSEARKLFLECARPSKSGDIDIVNIGSDPYPIARKTTGIIPSKANIKEGIEEEFDLVFKSYPLGGDMMDRLESVEEMEEFEFSEAILEDNTVIYTPTLLSIFKFKCREVSILADQSKKEDLDKLTIALKAVYDDNIINEILSEYNLGGLKK